MRVLLGQFAEKSARILLFQIAGKQNERSNMRHKEIKWNPSTREWFCVICGQTSDHQTEQDARRELEQFECKPSYEKPAE